MYWPYGVPQVYTHHGQQCAKVYNGKDELKRNESDDGSQSRAETSVESVGTNIQLDQEENQLRQKSIRTIIDLKTARADNIFVTITATTLAVWCSRPIVILASLERSSKSITSYGENASVAIKANGSIIVIRTTASFLITYAVQNDQNIRVLQQQYGYSQSKRQNVMRGYGVDESAGFGELLIQFRRAIKVDAGINDLIALDQELIVATKKPAAVQCINWEPQKDGSQAVAQLMSKTSWVGQKSRISSMTHDRAMNLYVWIASDGNAYAVQRVRQKLTKADSDEPISPNKTSNITSRLFDGYCFHKPDGDATQAQQASVNARFSLIAVAVSGGEIYCYTAKDYVGNIPLSHIFKVSVSPSAAGKMTTLTWSPDGYCLFAGYEHGWATWSVFGKDGATSFGSNQAYSQSNGEGWLLGIQNASWTSSGAEILLSSPNSDRIWKLEMSRSAATGCFSCANLVRALLQTPSEISVYQGHELPDLTSISNEASRWHHAPYPAMYLHNQWPIKSCVVSQDGRYVAVAGRRGLAHYSIQSGRWKVFSDIGVESSFAVRGGMCWFNHILAVATENAAGYDLRLYSRELDLGRVPLHSEAFSMPIVFVGPSGEDSLLVYTYENILYHYVLNITTRGAQLVQVGQIAFHGVVRAPSRVRSVSWIVPDAQLRSGDPSRDVEFASVLFLVDDKLVLLQPSRTPEDDLKYDMRVIAHHVEYYILMRDQIYFNFTNGEESVPSTPATATTLGPRSQSQHLLRDSLWIFSGDDLRLWPEIRDVLHHALTGDLAKSAPLLSMPVDFYPLSILLTKGIVLGIESELFQRRNVPFAQWRSRMRTQLFIPYMLRHQLCHVNDTAAAFGLANQYQHLSYFPHALEILLHHVLDDEVDRDRGIEKGKALVDISKPEPLPAVLSFLGMVLSPTSYLSTVVQCVRKTELSFWRTLFAHLPPPLSLFENALELQDLKTAGGYLIVLQGLEEDEPQKSSARQFESSIIRLMKLAKEKADFELCAELARFMMGIDPRGDTLRRVITAVGFKEKSTHLQPSPSVGPDSNDLVPKSLQPSNERATSIGPSPTGSFESSRENPLAGDYFSASPGGY